MGTTLAEELDATATSAARLREVLATALRHGRAELAKPRSGYDAPVEVAFAAHDGLLLAAAPAAPELRADPDAAGERWAVMGTALGYIAERPLFGVGLGNSIHVTVLRGGPAREVHNAYLKTGAELGVGGMIVYTLFILSALATAAAVRRRMARHPDGAELADG